MLAEEVTFTFNTDEGIAELDIDKPSSGSSTPLEENKHYTLNGVSLIATHGSTDTRVWNSSGTLDLRIYKNGSLTFTAPSKISKIVLTGSSVANFTTEGGSFKNGTWTGDAASVTLNASSAGKINTITVTYVVSNPTLNVATPSFNPEGGTYNEAKDVTISTTTAGATIYYTTNGESPTANSSVYSSAITISETTTLKAIAVKDGVSSSEATAQYVIINNEGLYVNFETNDLSSYDDWVFNNVGVNNNDISAHGGSTYGVNVNENGNGVSTASIQTKQKIALPETFTCYISKTSTNTNTSTWKIQVSSDGSSWTDVKSQSATSMTKGTWVEFTADLTDYSNVFVRLYYDGTNAIRAVDDISLTEDTPTSAITVDNWVLTSLADLTADDVFVIVGTNNAGSYALSNNNGTSSAPDAVAVKVDNETLSGDIADNIKWTISGNATDGYTFYPYGNAENWLYCFNDNNGVRVGTNNNKTFTLDPSGYLKHVGTSRYVGIYNSQDWRCYKSTAGNIADQTFAFYKKIETATIAINLACTDGTYYYGTYYINKAYVMPQGLTGQAVSVDTDGTLVVVDAYTEGTTVPANTALLIKAATAGNYTITLLNEGGTTNSDVTNQLKGTLTADEVTVGEGEGLFYRLTMHEGAIGFWWGAENGGSFAPGANKAYLFVPTNGQNLRQGFGMGGDSNGISDLLRSTDNAQRFYNLQGQRVMQPTKGLYIVNGKKVIIK